MSESDLPIAIGLTSDRILMRGYMRAVDTFSSWTMSEVVADYNAVKMVETGIGAGLDELASGAPISYDGFTESAETVQLRDFAKGLMFTRRMMINDRLGVLVRALDARGMRAKTKEAAIVYALLTTGGGLGPNLSDGFAVFDAAHNNLGAGTAVTDVETAIAQVSDLQAVQMAQTDLDGELIDMPLDRLIVPWGKAAIYSKAFQVEGGGAMAVDRDQTVPLYIQGFTIVPEARLTGTRVYGVSSMGDTIHCIRLQGQEGPRLGQEIDFDTEGAKFSVRHAFDAKWVSHRAAVTDEGA
jgi:hypothetical protein